MHIHVTWVSEYPRLSEEGEKESRGEATKRCMEELYHRQCGSRWEQICAPRALMHHQFCSPLLVSVVEKGTDWEWKPFNHSQDGVSFWGKVAFHPPAPTHMHTHISTHTHARTHTHTHTHTHANINCTQPECSMYCFCCPGWELPSGY